VGDRPLDIRELSLWRCVLRAAAAPGNDERNPRKRAAHRSWPAQTWPTIGLQPVALEPSPCSLRTRAQQLKTESERGLRDWMRHHVEVAVYPFGVADAHDDSEHHVFTALRHRSTSIECRSRCAGRSPGCELPKDSAHTRPLIRLVDQ
jgi:hypothetical protein